MEDTNYKDEWHIVKELNVGFSTDNYTNACSYSERHSYLYATTFYDELENAPWIESLYHYNKDSNTTASKNDFAVNGAMSNDIDFMIYIGHGLQATDSRGNWLHYSCDANGSGHSSDCENSVYNVDQLKHEYEVINYCSLDTSVLQVKENQNFPIHFDATVSGPDYYAIFYYESHIAYSNPIDIKGF